MNSPTIGRHDQVVSILGASRWLKARGIRPNSRHEVYRAIARGELAAREFGPRLWVIRVCDLERLAVTSRGEVQSETAKSAGTLSAVS